MEETGYDTVNTHVGICPAKEYEGDRVMKEKVFTLSKSSRPLALPKTDLVH